MGRPRKPLAAHLLDGTYRADRHGAATADPFDGEPKRPRNLTGDARKFWDSTIADLAERGIVKAVDAPACELLADLWAKYKAASRLLDASPTDKETRQAVVGFAAEFGKLAARFGLTPSDRQRLDLQQQTPSAGVDKRERRPAPTTTETTGDRVRRPMPKEWREALAQRGNAPQLTRGGG
jgi:phage terminase small subunit